MKQGGDPGIKRTRVGKMNLDLLYSIPSNKKKQNKKK